MSSLFSKIIFFSSLGLLITSQVVFADECSDSCGQPVSHPQVSYQECCSDSSVCNSTNYQSEPWGFCVGSDDLKVDWGYMPGGRCYNLSLRFCCDDGKLHTMSLNTLYWLTSADCGPTMDCQCQETTGGSCSGDTTGFEYIPSTCRGDDEWCSCPGWCCSNVCVDNKCVGDGAIPDIACSVGECINQGYTEATTWFCNSTCPAEYNSLGTYKTSACLFENDCACCVASSEPTPEICNNGIDDDGDGFIDCYDGDCPPDISCDSCQEASCSGAPNYTWECIEFVVCANNDSCCPSGCTYVSDNDCPAPPISIGYIKVQGPNGTIKLNMIAASSAIIAGKGVVKVAMFTGDIGSAADLVETDNPDASPVRIMTPFGIKAWRKID